MYTNEEVLELLDNFIIARPGMYNPPWRIIKACVENKDLTYLKVYEACLYTNWSRDDIDIYSLNYSISDNHNIVREFINGNLLPGVSWEELCGNLPKDDIIWYIDEMVRRRDYRNSYDFKKMQSKSFNRMMRSKLIKKDTLCIKCGSGEHLAIDHIVPLIKGGDNIESNVQVLCRSCNSRKGGKIDG